MKPIVDCDRRQEYQTPTGVQYICLPMKKPDGMSIVEALKHSEYFQKRKVTLADCAKCQGRVEPAEPKPAKPRHLCQHAKITTYTEPGCNCKRIKLFCQLHGIETTREDCKICPDNV